MARIARSLGIVLLSVTCSFLTVAALAAADPGGTPISASNGQGQAKAQATAPGQNKPAPASPASAAPASHQTTPQNGEAFSEPQPLSHADQNGTGANQRGPYDATPHYEPAPNGAGDGQASGKPCAGCVGKADNKNPGAPLSSDKGQMPSGPVDHNAGYECDRNQGIGPGNPAHTGCEANLAPSAETPPPSLQSTPPAGGLTPPPSPPPSVQPVAGSAAPSVQPAAGSAASPAPAASPTRASGRLAAAPESVEVLGVSAVRPAPPAAAPAAALAVAVAPVAPVAPAAVSTPAAPAPAAQVAAVSAAPGTLPTTGANIRFLVGLGVVLLLAGLLCRQVAVVPPRRRAS